MGQILLFIIAVVVIGVGFVLLVSKRAREEVAGICEVALGQTAKKNANKERAVVLLREKGELSNSEIREALGVSRRSAARYLDELEAEGKVEQVGNIGRSVVYRLR
ncbi:MAG TPA: SelB C-terminal domain-containing protein [Candidatus Paceibacterota bacterium]|nr:SelB C-terminal domain-containing protein [Candidatus Paceibacterota bacterium]